jgi:membrane protein implicated in regulation of membrane protease activity
MSLNPSWLPRPEAFPRKNILTPIGALAVAVLGTCTLGAVAVWPSTLSWALLAVGALPVAIALWGYVFFAVRDPDRLQTEDYRIQREYVAKLVTYVDGKEIRLDPRDAKITSNPILESGDSK